MANSINELKKIILDTTATNKNDLYNSHLYWSQKPYNICDILIENLSNEGDVIFDPFMGSGVTIIESLNKKYNRKAIGSEINEVPIFIVNTLLKKYDIKTISKKINEFIENVSNFQYYYKTECSACGNDAIIQKVIFDRDSWDSPYDLQKIHYKCKCSKKTLVKEPSQADVILINNNESIENITDIELIYNSRLAVNKGQKSSDIFTKRNFRVIDRILGVINNESHEFEDMLKYILLSIIHLAKITDLHSNSQWPLWTPKISCVEKNVIELIIKKSKGFINAIKYAEQNLVPMRNQVNNFSELKSGNYLILKCGSQNISEADIPNNSVDLVITDPPYLGQVLYSEYMQLYKPFLGLYFNLEDEIVVSTSPDRNKKEEEYYKLLEETIKRVSAKLKENKYVCMYFHDSNLDVWQKLISIFERTGLRYISQVHVKKSKSTLKNILSPKNSLNGDAILFFVKEPLYNKPNIEVEDIAEIERNIVIHAKYLIKQKGKLTTPELYDDGMMEFIIHNGWLLKLCQNYKSLVDIFEKYLIWDSKSGKWTI